jgi:magnesium transporter
MQSSSVSWIDIDGIHDSALMESIGREFGIHMLVLEDIMNSTSRPKIEIFDDYVFVTLKMLEFDPRTASLNIEQLSLILSEKYLLMFQERPGDSFNPIRERIRTAKGKVRTKNAHYLAYMILDVVIDNYIIVSEQFALQLERIESMVLRKPNERTMQNILGLRKELLDFKRTIDPLKEAINAMIRDLDDDMAKYYRDLYDHIIYESENLSTYREAIVNLLDLYHSNLSMKMNQVMKVLTIITTIFVPLTFIVGVYGMNFDNMPELRSKNGYFVVLGFMFILVCGMLIYFRKKRWL